MPDLEEAKKIVELEGRVTNLEKEVKELKELTKDYPQNVERLNNIKDDIKEIKSMLEDIKKSEADKLQKQITRSENFVNTLIEKGLLVLLGGGVTYFIQQVIGR